MTHMGTTVIDDSRRGRNNQLEPPRVEPPFRRPRARALWWLAGLVLLASSLAWGVYTLVTVIAHEERTETTRFGAKGVEVLDVNSDGGRVTVTGRADLDEIVITADIGEGLRRTGNRQEIVDGRLELDATCPVLGSNWCSVDYTIEVPREMTVVASSDTSQVEVHGIDGEVTAETDNGAIVVDDITGPLEVSSDNGAIVVDDVTGRLEVSSDNGSVAATDIVATEAVVETDNGSISLEFSVAPSSVRADNSNGDVDVMVPQDGGDYLVDAVTGNGQVTTDVRTAPNADRTMELDTSNGDIAVRYGG